MKIGITRAQRIARTTNLFKPTAMIAKPNFNETSLQTLPSAPQPPPFASQRLPSAPQPPPLPERVIPFQEYLQILWRRRFVILLTFVLFVVIGAVITFRTRPTYRAIAFLLVDPPANTVNQVDAANPFSSVYSASPEYRIETQINLLQDKNILESTKTKMGLGDADFPKISVKAVENTDIIEIHADGADPKVTADTANTLVDTYIDEVANVNGRQVKQALDFTTVGAKKAQLSLEAAERQLRDFKQRNQLVDLDKNREDQINLVSTLDEHYEGLQAKLAAARNQLTVLGQQIKLEPPVELTAVSPASDAQVQATEAQIATLTAQRAGLLNSYTPESKKVTDIDAQITALQTQRTAQQTSFAARNQQKNPNYSVLRVRYRQLEVEASGLASEATATSQRLAAARTRLSQFASWELEIARLQRQLSLAKDNYLQFTAKREDLRLRDQVSHVGSRIMERASVPVSPIQPKKALNLFFASFVGLIAALALALGLEFFDNKIHSPQEANRLLRLPNLGMIPVIPKRNRLLFHADKQNSLARSDQTSSAAIEFYRRLRTNIYFATADNPFKTLLVTSAATGDGKSMTAANLAFVMALEGKQILLVDTNLQAPALHGFFNIGQGPGLTDLLLKTHTMADVLQLTNVDNIRVITAGSAVANSSELLGSKAMEQFLTVVRDYADIILFDSSPIGPFYDAARLSTHLDGVLFVVGAGKTTKSGAAQALDLLSRARANVLGMALNKVRYSEADYYGTSNERYYWRPQVGDNQLLSLNAPHEAPNEAAQVAQATQKNYGNGTSTGGNNATGNDQ